MAEKSRGALWGEAYNIRFEQIQEKIPDVKVNGHRTKRLPGNANISFENVDGEQLLLKLDEVGICASSGSACNTGTQSPSHVLTAIGLTSEEAGGALRITFGDDNTLEDVDFLIDNLKKFLKKNPNDGSRKGKKQISKKIRFKKIKKNLKKLLTFN